MLECVIYCRVSSKEQKDEGTSLDVQEEMCEDYAIKNGLAIQKSWVVDEPASKPGRKHFNEMLAYAQKNSVEHILVVDASRLHRNKKDETKVDELVEQGFSFHFVSDGTIISDDADEIKRLMQEFKNLLSRYEVGQLKVRVLRSMKKKLKDGVYPGLAPIGYINVPDSKGRERRIEQTKDAPIVKKFLEMFATGKYTTTEMVDVARKIGLKSKNGNPLGLPSVKYILKNRFYCGEWEWSYKTATKKIKHKEATEVYKGKANGQWEPIVTKAVIDKNVMLMKKFSLKYKKSKGRDFRYKGLIWCSECGGSFIGSAIASSYKIKGTGELRNYEPRIYYRCNPSDCPTPSFTEDLVESEILRNIGYLEFDEEVWKRLRKDLFEMDTKEMLSKERKILNTEKTKVEGMEDRLYDDLLEDLIDKPFYTRKIKDVRDRREEIVNRLEELEVELELWTEGVEKVVDMIDNLKDFKAKFQKANDTTKQHMIKLMTNRIVACGYTGDNPKVDRKLSRTLEFEWNDEFKALFEMGVIKGIDKQAKEWTDKHGPKSPPGSKPGTDIPDTPLLPDDAPIPDDLLRRKKGDSPFFPGVNRKGDSHLFVETISKTVCKEADLTTARAKAVLSIILTGRDVGMDFSMKGREHIICNFRGLITFFCILLAVFIPGCKKEAERLPNVVIIFTDDQGYADVGCYGAEGFTTPNLDRMAAEGMRFTSFYVSQAVCSASRASLMTGCYAERVSIRGALMPWSENGLHPDEETIAEVLKKKGYATAIFGKWHLGHQKEFLPLQHGFDEYFGLPYSNDMWPVDYRGRPITEEDKGEKPEKLFYPVLPLIEGNEKVVEILTLDDQSTLTTQYTERAVRFVDRNKDRPFFLYLPHSMAHVPLGVSDKFKGKSGQGMYGDVIMEIDWSVGEILKALKRYDLEEDTLVIFASDNGPWLNYGNHAGSAYPLREAKGTAWEGGVRVPCIMRWTGRIPAGTICDKMATTIDVLPTLAAIVDTPLPKNPIDGVNILPLMEAKENANPRDHFFFYYGRALRAVRKGRWKLYFPHGFNSYSGVVPGADGYPGPYNFAQTGLELYDLERDVSETLDVAAQHPDIVKELQALAEKAREDLGDSLTDRTGKNVRAGGRRWGNKKKSVQHLAMGKKISLAGPYSPMYVASGDLALIDGIRGSTFHNDGSWQGFEQDDLEAIVDLGEEKLLKRITCGFLENQYAWIFYPRVVEISISRDGVTFDLIQHTRNKALIRNSQPRFKDYVTDLPDMRARYIRIKARNVGICPDWHPGAGGKAWLFCDEIIIE